VNVGSVNHLQNRVKVSAIDHVAFFQSAYRPAAALPHAMIKRTKTSAELGLAARFIAAMASPSKIRRKSVEFLGYNPFRCRPDCR
jgi:hypothetical protein